MTKEITPKKFDVLTAKTSGDVPIIWGCKAIGQAIGRSPDYVRNTLAKLDGTPVRRQGREYYARRSELDQFFR